MIREHLSKMHVTESKAVSSYQAPHDEKTRGEKMKDSLAMLLKTNGGKMSVYRPLAMLMKTKDVHVVSRDIDEKKRSYRKTGAGG